MFHLTAKQAALGAKLARKYRKQLPSDLVDTLQLAPKK